jgi:antitoxin component YwqK of YwqJK toxin-antitoxin module
MNLIRALIPLGGLAISAPCQAQPDTLMLAHDEHYVMGDAGADPAPDLNVYDRFNSAMGGDSLRDCGGFPCIGWVEDRYPNGQLKHRGYYDAGRLVVYKNYHGNGSIEREFKRSDDVRSVQRSWHANGQPRSEARYADGTVVFYQDHYVNGAVRYVEERHRATGCFTRLELYAADGNPISLLKLVDKGRLLLEMTEFHPGGALRSKGRAQFDRRRMDAHRIGTWIYYDAAGAVVKEEDYIDGKVHAVR